MNRGCVGLTITFGILGVWHGGMKLNPLRIPPLAALMQVSQNVEPSRHGQ